MGKVRCLLCYWCGRLPRSVKKSPIEDISLRARPTLEEDQQQLTGSGLRWCRFCLATAIIIKDLQESFDSAIAGLILGAAYMLADRNLWACILTHGFIDTFGVIDAFFGWSK